ncbi:hypothetical protein D3C75_1277340 [compost metagenome]
MRFAHPIAAGLTITALPAGHDLFGNDAFADLVLLLCAFSHGNNAAVEFVAGYDRRFYPRVFTPKHLGTVFTLTIASTDPATFDLDHQLLGFR